MTSSKTKRIDFIAPPFSGHLYPLIELAKPLLGNEEYEVRFLTGPKKIELLTELGFQTVALLPERPTAMEEIANTKQAVKSNAFSMMKQLKENLQIIPEITNQIREEISRNHTDLIVADFIAVPGGIVANEKNIPWITTIPTPFAMETQQGVPSYLGGLKPNPSLVGRVRDYLGRKLIRLFKKVVVYFFRKEMRELGVELYNQKGEEAIYSPYAILGLGMREVEFNTDFPEQFVFAGPCCASPEEDVKLSFEASFEKKVFVTVGTHLKWVKDSLITIIEELSSEYPNYLFVLSLGESEKREQPAEQYRGNVWIYPYVPYSEYVTEFDWVIHHGGAGIFYQCIKHNKPAIIIPQDYDQFDYAARAEVAGIATVAKKLNEKDVKAAFSEAVRKTEWTGLEKVHQDFKTYQPSEVLLSEINRLIK